MLQPIFESGARSHLPRRRWARRGRLAAALAPWLLTAAALAESAPTPPEASHADLAVPLDLRLATPPPQQPGASWNAKFVTQQGGYTFALEPVDVRATGFQVKVQIAGGGFQAHTPAASKTYRGTIVEIPGSRVAASVLTDGVYALVLVPSGPDLYVMPSSGLGSAVAPPGHHTVVRATDGAGRITLLADPRNADDKLGVGPAQCVVDGFCVADVALDADYDTFIGVGLDIDAVVDLGEGAVNMKNLRFEDDFDISHRVAGMVIRTSLADDPYAGVGHDFVLSAMAGEWCNTCSPTCTLCQTVLPRDHVHLMGGIGGASRIGGICDANDARSFGAMNGLDDPNSVARMIHEMGHSWGSFHFNGCPGIMSAGSLDVTRPFCGVPVRTAIEGKRDQIATTCLDTVIPDGRIFADGHEAGDLDAWPVVTDPEGRLTVISGGAVLFGSHSLEVDLAGAGTAWVADELPTVERGFQARFHLDAGGMLNTLMGGMSGPIVQLVDLRSMDGAAMASVELRRTMGIVPLELRLITRRDNGTDAVGPWTGVPALANGPVEIIVAWDAASTVGANNGAASVQVNGVTVASEAGLDNDQGNVDSARLGAVSTTGGTFSKGNQLILDGYESRREGPFEPPL